MGIVMGNRQNELEYRQVGKGFIVDNIGGIIGRKLTETFVDQFNQTYIKINGELVLLTDEHSYLSVD